MANCLYCGVPCPNLSTDKDNPTHFCSRKHRRKHQKERSAARAGKVTRGMRNQVYLRDGFICQICGSPCDTRKLNGALFPSVDHIVPVSHGGLSVLENLQTAHRRCNSSKHGLDDDVRR